MSLTLGSAVSGSIPSATISATGDIRTEGDVYARSFNTLRGYILNLHVEEIDNGLLMHLGFAEREIAKRIFIKDLSEMPDILVAQIAARRMEASRNGGTK